MENAAGLSANLGIISNVNPAEFGTIVLFHLYCYSCDIYTHVHFKVSLNICFVYIEYIFA
jgi:hypothetical protein